jgi:hypothetical protein
LPALPEARQFEHDRILDEPAVDGGKSGMGLEPYRKSA